MKNFIKDIKPFEIILISIAIFFSFTLYLSIPVLFNYESFGDKLEKEINKDFKIHLKNISGIKYNFIPSPHLIIEQSDLYLDKNEKVEIAKIKKLKIYLSLFQLYRDKKINIKEIYIKNANLNFNYNHLKNFYEHLNAKINKKIVIQNSNFFYKNKLGEVTTISPVKKLDYFIDFKNKQKNLNIVGNLFDVDYKFLWEKNYQNPNLSQSSIKFKNPNIKINNKTYKDIGNDNYNVVSKINFLDLELNIKLKIEKNKIIFMNQSLNETRRKINFNGDIDLKPFYFNLNLLLIENDIKFFIDNLLFYLHSLNDSIHQNFSGNLKIEFKNIKNDLFNNGFFNLKFLDKKIVSNNSFFQFGKIGKITFDDFNYVQRTNQLFFETSLILEMKNLEEFYKKFQIPKKTRINNIKKIYFDIEKNIDNNSYSISNIFINSKPKEIDDDMQDHYTFKNIQQLRKIIKEKLNSIN